MKNHVVLELLLLLTVLVVESKNKHPLQIIDILSGISILATGNRQHHDHARESFDGRRVHFAVSRQLAIRW